MNIKQRTPDLQKVHNDIWKANNFNHNGIKEKIESNNNHFNKMLGVKPKEEWNKEILKATSVEGKIKNLQDSMGSLNNFNRNSFK